MKKRIVSLILCGLMVFSAAGCSGGGENKAGKDDVTLTMWTHINEPWNAAYKDAIKEFESENEGVRIKLETFPYDEFESKVQTALIDGEGGADIYELWGGWALDFTPYGTLMELPEENADLSAYRGAYQLVVSPFDVGYIDAPCALFYPSYGCDDSYTAGNLLYKINASSVKRI